MQYRKKRSKRNALAVSASCALLSVTGAVITAVQGTSLITPLTAALSAFFFALFALVTGRYLTVDLIYSITNGNRFEIHSVCKEKSVRVFSMPLSNGNALVKMSDFKKMKKEKKEKSQKDEFRIEASFCSELFSRDKYVFTFCDSEDEDGEGTLVNIVINTCDDFAKILLSSIGGRKN